MAANFAKPFWQAHCAEVYGHRPRSAACKGDDVVAFAPVLEHALQDHTAGSSYFMDSIMAMEDL